MKQARHYRGSLTREQFLFREIRIVAQMLCEQKNKPQIIEEIMRDNLFQFPTERMLRSVAETCFRRIDALDSDTLFYHLANASSDIARQINLYAIMRDNGIVYDFMTDVIGTKYRTQQLDYSVKDANVFLMKLPEVYPSAGEWADSTRAKLRQVLTNFLVSCGYLENSRAKRLNPVYLYPELEDGIRALGDTDAFAAFNYIL